MSTPQLSIAAATQLAAESLQNGDYARVLGLCADILRLDSGNVAALVLLGSAYAKQGQFQQAIGPLEKVVRATPGDVRALNNLGYVLMSSNRLDDALPYLRQAIERDSAYAPAHINYGLVLQRLKRWGEAHQMFDKAIALSPTNADALNNRGCIHMRMMRMTEALADFDAALRHRPDFVDAHLNRGVLFTSTNQISAAQQAFDNVLALNPNDPTALWAKGQTLILEGKYTEGWKLYENRWHSSKFSDKPRAFPAPLWLGQNSLTGRSILIHAEQGFGDTMQFCRYIPLLGKQAAEVIFMVQPELTRLLNDSGLGATVITPTDRVPPFDVHFPLMSLPHAFATTLQTVPSGTPYLRSDATRVSQWQARLGPKTHLRVGIAWAGRPTHINDDRRSIGLDGLLTLLSPGFEFHALGKEGVPPHLTGTIQDHAGELQDFADTAALVSCLDLVISVDTSVVHLAGALGKPVWTLLAFAPDFRWMLERPDTPWYPTMRLFRQRQLGDWNGVIAEVQQALRLFRPQ
jgi:tetratricopeptide (TPR) repeat protein